MLGFLMTMSLLRHLTPLWHPRHKKNDTSFYSVRNFRNLPYRSACNSVDLSVGCLIFRLNRLSLSGFLLHDVYYVIHLSPQSNKREQYEINMFIFEIPKCVIFSRAKKVCLWVCLGEYMIRCRQRHTITPYSLGLSFNVPWLYCFLDGNIQVN